MKIHQLPQEIQDLVYKEAKLQGSSPRSSLYLISGEVFTWKKTTQGYDFWSFINNGDYSIFYEKYKKIDNFSII